MGTESFTNVMSDGTKVTVTVERPAPVQPQEPEFLLGMTCDPKDYDTELERFNKSAFTRVFSSNNPPLWTDSRIKKLFDRDMIPFISFKSVLTDEYFIKYLDGIPEDRQIFATWMHEPEPKRVDPGLFKREHQRYWRLVQAHPRANDVVWGAVLTRQWTENTAGRTYATYDPGVGDFLGCDMYANTWENSYPDPNEFLRYFAAYALTNANGRDIIVPEYGAVKMASDRTGEARAKWLTDVTRAMSHQFGFKAAAWWNDLGTVANDGSERDFRLTDNPSANAFSALLDRFNP